MKFYFALLFLLNSQVFGQSFIIDRHFFENNIWACNSEIFSEYSKDSITLIQVKGYRKDETCDSMNLFEYFKTDYSILSLQKRKKLVIKFYSLNSWTITRFMGLYYWEFDENYQILTIYKQDIVVRKFQVLTDMINFDLIPSKTNSLDKVRTIRLTLKSIAINK